AADDIGLLPAEPTLLKQGHHVEGCITAGKRQVLAFDLAMRVDRHPHDAEKILGHRNLRIGEIARMHEDGSSECSLIREAFVYLESHYDCSPNPDGSNTALAIALRKMSIAGREGGAFHIEGKKKLGPLVKLLHVKIPAVLSRRDSAQPFHAAAP